MMVMNFFKKILFSLLILFSPLHPACAMQEPIKIVALDWHDVVVKKQIMQTTYEAVKFWWENREDSALLFKSALGIGYTALKNVVTKNGKKLSVGDILQKYPELEKYKEKFYYFATLEKPIDGMLALINRLKEKNIKIVLASNMNEDSLRYSIKTKPEIFSLFDAYYVYSDKNGEKPDKKYYDGLRRKINKKFFVDVTKEILFVDDKRENVDGAVNAQVNIKAVHFKNVQQLLSALVEDDYLKEHDVQDIFSLLTSK